MQPFVIDEHGVIRFQENSIVRVLLDEATERGFGLNELSRRSEFTQKDWEQFSQLTGYSLGGYHELSFVSFTKNNASSISNGRSLSEALKEISSSTSFINGAEISSAIYSD